MTRHPTARRVHRQETGTDDAFVAGVLETSVWAKQHQRILIISAAVAAIIIVGLVLWLNNRASTRAAAVEELTRVRAVVMSGNNPLAINDLQGFLARFGGTPSAAEARLHLGQALLRNGQAQQAIEALRPLARDVDDDMGANAAFLTAVAYETLQEPHRAEEIYLRVADEARFLFHRQEALDNAARIRVQRGDAAGAAQLYERAVEITPETNPDRQVLELRLGEARALAASPAGAQPQTPPTLTPTVPPTGVPEQPAAPPATESAPAEPPPTT
jgi:predicted negative regulator of RcsB-dependent stress response